MTGSQRHYDDWHWWSSSDRARSVAKKEFEKLPLAIQGEFLAIMGKWLTQTHARSDYDVIGRGLHELRVRVGNSQFRVLFEIKGRICVVLTAFMKKQQQLPRTAEDRARARMKYGVTVAMTAS